jgi:hypothetical protein
MKTTVSLLLHAATLILLASALHTDAADSAGARKLFAKPTRDCANAPLWVWNDMMTERQVVETMRDLAGQQVKQVFVHPRPGLMTPYLSPEWFRLWKVALREAERLDMNCWIYDENSYPSGFAGGWVPELMPESRGRGLHLREHKKAPQWSDDYIAVFQLTGDKAVNVTAKVRAGALPAGRYVTAEIKRAEQRPWHGGRTYVDLLYPGVTEKFLNVTLEAYRREIGSQFGKRVPGSFTDEPEIRPAGGLPWTEDLPQQFQKRWGYGLMENLASLSQPVGDWKKVRHDFFATLLSLFIERWAKPYYEYCAKHGLAFTGHYWEHDWPRCIGVTDNMAMAAWQQLPGIDILMNQYREDTHAQFGNVRACREISSLANQLGRKRTLVELYGAGGWDLRFEDMKCIGDWLEVLGVNLLDEHLSYATLRGARKRDHPQSFSYHEPWWKSYHVSASYFQRLTAALTQGEQINRVLIIEPTTTAWMNQNDEARLKELGDAFFNLLMSLEAAQVEYDIGCEDVLANHGSVSGAALRVGKRDYTTVVLPPLAENLESKTAALFDGYLKAGGSILCAGEPPARVDGAVSQRGAELARNAKWKKIEAAALPELLRKATEADGFAIGRVADDKGILFHHRRQFDDGDLLFLVNTSIESPSAGVIESRARGVEQWDLRTGKSAAYRFEPRDSGVRATFSLPPSGSLLLFLSKKACAPAPVVEEKVKHIAAAGPPQIRRIEPNVLTLDVVDITAGGETRANVYFYQAQQFAFQKNGMERNPWDSAVQFKDEIITKKLPKESGFEASYHFTIDSAVPKNLAIVIERPDLYTVACNGQPVRAAKGAWWLDKAFGRIAIASAARLGENVVIIKASPMTIFHELEPAYVLGDFSLKPTARGFNIAPPQPLRLGRWNEQGAPFFSAGVAYRQTFNVASPAGRYAVTLPSWYGSVAKVLVNGKLAGHISCPPWRCDVSGKLKRGANTIEVVVIGTLKNTLGPHHGKQPLGSAWPRMFQIGPKVCPAPGADYDTVGYGLFAPFALEQMTP